MKNKKPTIAELQALLENEEEAPIEILPNGEIRTVKKRKKNQTLPRVLTMKEALGGEYGIAA